MSESEIWITLSLMVLCLIAEGFFSGSELGVVSADRMKLRHDAAKGSRGARLALEMLEKRPEWLLSTTLVGTNIAVVTQLDDRHGSDDLAVR
jgi:putative hemolysin